MSISLWPHFFYIQIKSKMVVFQEKGMDVQASNFSMQTQLDYLNNMGWVPSVSPGECYKHTYMDNPPFYIKKKGKNSISPEKRTKQSSGTIYIENQCHQGKVIIIYMATY